MSDPISVIYCYPRSGGTLLSQCILCEPNNIVLSEVNPAGSVVPVEAQAAEWFHLLTESESKALAGLSYLEKIREICQRTRRAGFGLCLRDWTGINFLDGISPWHGRPSYILEQRFYARRGGLDVKEIAFVRRSEAVYASIRGNIPELANLAPEDFVESYEKYLMAITDVPKFFLEDFITRKGEILAKICNALGLRFAAEFEKRFHEIKTVTGNTTLPNPAASASWSTIRTKSRPEKTRKAAESLPAAKATELDRLAGYTQEDRP
ncbi:MAG: hypothetical protein JWM32_1137 [Verrucomicrobia bacterium]|nr:hypothetical protein [Verrucomicrobiota bacterium]